MIRGKAKSLYVALAVAIGMSAAMVGGAASASTVAKPKYGGNLVVADPAGPWVSMDPFNPTIPPATAELFPYIEPLYHITSAGKLLPWLALGSKATNGGLTITYTLRQGVKFQDGTPFNAAAVQWNFQRSATASVASECYTYFSVVSSVSTVGKYQVVVNLSQPDSAFSSYLATLQCGLMVSPTAYQANPTGFANNPVGTGPFRYVSGTTGTSATFDRFNGYWGGKPYLSSITIQTTTADEAAFDSIETGQAQVEVGYGQDVASQIASTPSIKSGKAPAASVNYVTFSFTHAPFTNPLAREAVFEATNSQSIRQNLYDNFYPAAQGPIPPAEEGYTKTVKGYPGYNLSAATALVSQIGGLKFTLFEGNTTAAIQEGEALQAMWEAAGMQVTLNPLASGALIAADHAHTYDALLITFPATSQPDQLLYRFFYSGSPISQGGMVDQTLDAMILKARASFAAKTQTQLYQQIDTRLEAVDYTNDVIYSSNYHYAYLKQVQGFSANPFNIVNWQLVWLK